MGTALHFRTIRLQPPGFLVLEVCRHLHVGMKLCCEGIVRSLSLLCSLGMALLLHEHFLVFELLLILSRDLVLLDLPLALLCLPCELGQVVLCPLILQSLLFPSLCSSGLLLLNFPSLCSQGLLL